MVRVRKQPKDKGMGTLKSILKLIAAIFLALPCLLIFNTSDTVIPNMIGIIYLYMIGKAHQVNYFAHKAYMICGKIIRNKTCNGSK